jgi:hypothetical protein
MAEGKQEGSGSSSGHLLSGDPRRVLFHRIESATYQTVRIHGAERNGWHVFGTGGFKVKGDRGDRAEQTSGWEGLQTAIQGRGRESSVVDELEYFAKLKGCDGDTPLGLS